MPRPDFEKCTAIATELLYKQNISNRVLDIRSLNYEGKTIVFESIQNYARIVKRPLSDFLSEENQTLKEGCTVIIDDIYIVLYNDQITYYEHLNWTLAHEIGHIYLGHKLGDETEEIEAHFFAAQLFMPEYSIYMIAKEYGPVNPDVLIEIFGVSPEAAEKRIKTMNRKIFFRSSNIDKEIWNIQRERVELYFECNKNSYEYRSILNYLLYINSENERMLWAH